MLVEQLGKKHEVAADLAAAVNVILKSSERLLDHVDVPDQKLVLRDVDHGHKSYGAFFNLTSRIAVMLRILERLFGIPLIS